MEPVAASEFVVPRVDTPAVELQDFDRIVQVYWPRVFRFVLASVRDRDAAQTLTQDCFWRAYRNRGGFRGEASVNTWLMRIAVNLVRDFARNRRLQFWKRMTASSTDDRATSGDASPESKAVLNDQVQAIFEAASVLPNRQRTVFLLRFVEEMDLREIAAATGLSEGAVKVHLFRALQSIRKKLRSRQ
jgi:RNA polymerase sigma-70 factor (ECF subfamily)